MKPIGEHDLKTYVAAHCSRLIEITQDLVRIPSENRAPVGAELACQEYVAAFLRRCGWDPVVYRLDEAPGLSSHPLFWPGRDYHNRPNVAARRAGSGGGRSLVLSGHVDTVPVGSQPWTRDPFGGQIEGNRLYGRGSNDMKCGVATNLFVAEAIADLGLELQGDLIVESVVDEEFGGVNGTLAGRLMGFNGDAAIISEPSFLRICPAQRGGRTVHITFSAPNGGVLSEQTSAGVVHQLRIFLDALDDFRTRRRNAPRHSLYSHLQDPVPVTVTRIFTAPWGTSEPTNTPDTCRVELFWQNMPGECLEDVDEEFRNWLEGLLEAHTSTFASRPVVEHPIRWLPGSAIAASEPLVTELRSTAASVLPFEPRIEGIEGPCDMYVFHSFGIPAVLWGARGGNTHNADEYVEIDSLVQAATVLLKFVCRWCGMVR